MEKMIRVFISFDYDYQVRVNGVISYTAARNITHWRIDNYDMGDKKSFHSGFSLTNTERSRFGIGNYIAENQSSQLWRAQCYHCARHGILKKSGATNQVAKCS